MIEKILAVAQAAQNTVSGKLGFAFCDLETGKTCCLHENTPFPTASVFKIFLLAELYRQLEAGTVQRDTCLRVEPVNAAPGSGALKRFHHAADLTVYNHAVLMMMLSDNTSTDLLFNLVTREAILEHLILPLGLHDTKIDLNCTDLIRLFYGGKIGERQNLRNTPAVLCQTEKNNCTSPRDIIKLLQSIYKSTILSEAGSRELLELMQPYPKYHRLEKYLPMGTKIRRKTGSLDRVVNDAGIVFTDKGDYIIGVFYNGNTANEADYAVDEKKLQGEELISKLSEEVYRLYMERNV